ncbi:hypothetical protein PIB30_032067 [Stylosanthes scabra]|uniref:DEK-C domain-containing protein n=1 Tax=Stylosanthes scabra TaxID=79078 RepID=A0ABU6RCD3_9FABA|nr:hypothetical protein [Stylosanthes scabra]
MATETLDDPRPQLQVPNGDAATKAESVQHEIQGEENQHDKVISDDNPDEKNSGQLEEENVDREDDEEEEEDEDEEGEKKESNAVTPVKSASGGRPTRERKSVERYTVSSPHKFPGFSANKTISIDKGNGTELKDIPNVAFKLSKRKVDDNLRSLHSVLFGKKAKAQTLKRNIGMFSGYVWAENEEKQRAKVKERLDRCVKEKLVDFCDLLNLQINKSTLKKEELSAKLLEFLESPHATTDVLLAEKEKKGKKRAKKKTPRKSSGNAAENPSKKQKRSTQGKKRKQSSDSDEDDTAEPSDATNGSQEDGEDVSTPKSESDREDDESHSDEEVNNKTSEETVNEDQSTPVKKTSSEMAAENNDKIQKKSTASKRQKTDTESRERKDNISKKVNAQPTKEDMHAVVVDMLKEVDFNTATLSDIIKKLGTHFGLDLMHRKAEVKDIITNVINNMSDEENEGGDDADEDKADEDNA